MEATDSNLPVSFKTTTFCAKDQADLANIRLSYRVLCISDLRSKFSHECSIWIPCLEVECKICCNSNIFCFSSNYVWRCTRFETKFVLEQKNVALFFLTDAATCCSPSKQRSTSCTLLIFFVNKLLSYRFLSICNSVRQIKRKETSAFIIVRMSHKSRSVEHLKLPILKVISVQWIKVIFEDSLNEISFRCIPIDNFFGSFVKSWKRCRRSPVNV